MKIPASRQRISQRINEKGAASTSRNALQAGIFGLGLLVGIACTFALPAIGQGVLEAMDREAAFEEARIAAHLSRVNAEMQAEGMPPFVLEETRPIK